MRLDAASESVLMGHSRRLDLPFGAVIQGFVIEGTLHQITGSSFGESLWLADSHRIGRSAYEQNKAGRLEFYYIESEKPIPENRLIPGQRMSQELIMVMTEEFFPEKNRWHIHWNIEKCRVRNKEASLEMIGEMEGMRVPLEIRIHGIYDKGMAPRRNKITTLIDEKREISFLEYPTEDMIIEQFIEIMMKLELISDMSPYACANEILCEQSVSGRYVIAVLKERSESEPTLRKEKRLEQLKSYRDYTYMRKRWEKYQKHRDCVPQDWSDVMDCIINFAEPIWHAFLNDEIFLDDWMPELRRFLG